MVTFHARSFTLLALLSAVGCYAGEPATGNGDNLDPDIDVIEARKVCGDHVCNGGETAKSCPADCAPCGDGVCSAGENATSCPLDCSSGTPGLLTGSVIVDG